MFVLDELIKFLNSTLGQVMDLYRFFYILGFLTIFVFSYFYAKKYRLPQGKSLLVSIVSYLLIFGWAYVLAWVESLFTDWGHHNAVRVYIWMPFLLFVLSKIVRMDWRTLCDFTAPSACIVYGIARLGCLFPGCCYGIRCEWGIYSGNAGDMVFPVQLCEALTSLVLAAFCLHRNKKKNYAADGRTYFIMLIPYGLGRFIWEFFADNQKVFLNISSLALHALLMSVVGAVMLVVLHHREKKGSRTAA